MSQPLDPHDIAALNEGESEYGWGPGMFQPGIADNEGQSYHQDDFGEMLPTNKIGDKRDNYARMVADKRTDPTDPDSSRDFEALGNPDRFGGNPPLIRAKTQRNVSQREETIVPTKVERKW